MRVGVSKRTISLYETEKPPPQERLVSVLAAMDYQIEDFDFALHGLNLAVGSREVLRLPADMSTTEIHSVHHVALRVGQASADLVERHLVKLARALRVRKDRSEARRLWQVLKSCSSRRRWLLVTKSRQFQSWGLAELLCYKSEQAASNRTDRALELATLACRVAELAPGEESWRSRLRGYCLVFLANARRVANDLDGADDAFACAWKLWTAGTTPDPGLLAEWRLFDREASLRRCQRRFSEALELLNRARSVAPLEAVARILVNRAATFLQQGDAKHAVEALREAAPLADCRRDPHLLFTLRFNLAVSLCDLDRYAEAEMLLPDVREIAARLRKELDLVRVAWLAGRLNAGLGRVAEAREAFEQVKREFAAREMPYDYALVSMDLAVLLLKQGRAMEVQELAEEMMWIFKAQGIHREALAALMLREAASKDEAKLKVFD